MSQNKNINVNTNANVNVNANANTKVIKVNETKKTSTDINTYEYSDLLKNSFQITYVLLLTTATITIIEALRTNNPEVRHILNLETCISIIAGYFYSVFIVKIEDYKDRTFNWKGITRIRYIDWSITTPLMLLVLCLVLSMQSKKSVNVFIYLGIVLLNYAMLIMGYLGEADILNRFLACILGFIPFFAMFYIIYVNYVNTSKSGTGNYVLFILYLIVWSMYGIVFLLPEEIKNTATNFLDLTAKCFIGLGLWAYYTGVLSN
jgi:bacteriorhodopsin